MDIEKAPHSFRRSFNLTMLTVAVLGANALALAQESSQLK
jgi:hypothetical protein